MVPLSLKQKQKLVSLASDKAKCQSVQEPFKVSLNRRFESSISKLSPGRFYRILITVQECNHHGRTQIFRYLNPIPIRRLLARLHLNYSIKRCLGFLMSQASAADPKKYLMSFSTLRESTFKLYLMTFLSNLYTLKLESIIYRHCFFMFQPNNLSLILSMCHQMFLINKRCLRPVEQTPKSVCTVGAALTFRKTFFLSTVKGVQNFFM